MTVTADRATPASATQIGRGARILSHNRPRRQRCQSAYFATGGMGESVPGSDTTVAPATVRTHPRLSHPVRGTLRRSGVVRCAEWRGGAS